MKTQKKLFSGLGQLIVPLVALALLLLDLYGPKKAKKA